jgi:hypothetical protein
MVGAPTCADACDSACSTIANLDCLTMNAQGCAIGAACAPICSYVSQGPMFRCGGQLFLPTDGKACAASLQKAGVKVL